MAIADKIIGIESGGDRYARNPRSSAAGAGQFIASTWLATVKKHRPDVAAGKTDAQLLQLRFDPDLSREMTDAYAADNNAFLKARGISPTEGNTYLAHFAGPQGAAALHANPAASVEATLGRGAIAANPFLRGKTGQDVIDWAHRKAGQASPAASTMAEGLRRRFAPKTEGGVVSGGDGATAMAGGSGMDRLKGALGGRTYDPTRIEAAGGLIKTGQDVAGKANNWQTALAGIATAGVGNYLQHGEQQKKAGFDQAFSEAA